MKAAYRVLDREDGNENIHPAYSDARTEQGFLKLFYSHWPTAPRGKFYAEVSDGRADIYSKATNRRVASFILVE